MKLIQISNPGIKSLLSSIHYLKPKPINVFQLRPQVRRDIKCRGLETVVHALKTIERKGSRTHPNQMTLPYSNSPLEPHSISHI